MKIDRSKLKKSTSEVPIECRALIERLKACRQEELLIEFKKIDTWTFGKCELYHWIDILDICDDILEEATKITNHTWVLACDDPVSNRQLKELLLWVLHFTTLLIEHSFSRHLYNSMEHLLKLLSSSDMHVILGVLNLLYMFSKRSNFIPRLNTDIRHALIRSLTYLAETWGGKENGFGLAECCKDLPLKSFSPGATSLHFEYYTTAVGANNTDYKSRKNVVVSIIVESVDKMKMPVGEIMEVLLKTYGVPEDKRMLLFTQLRLAYCFSKYEQRLLCVQARLQALSVLVYSIAITENAHLLLYPGLLEELVEVLELTSPNLVEIRSAALRTLTSIIHLERNPIIPKLNMIIRITGAASYHGFLPTLVRTCITSLTYTPNSMEASSSGHVQEQPQFPLLLATALFSFLYHMASYEAGGEALVSCGMMDSLLRVIKWPGTELEHITFVTRAVRVIDLITNNDMQAFQMHGGLAIFINRLEMEVNTCRKEQPFVIKPHTETSHELEHEEGVDHSPQGAAASQQENTGNMDLEIADIDPSTSSNNGNDTTNDMPKQTKPCLPQRAALLKSMLNFLKKAIQDPSFSDSIRHVMDGSLPSSLKHIISNAEYYGPSLFLLATDVVTVYVFQEPSLLSFLQDNGLTDVVLHALLVKEVPATREVLGSLPNVFSALCLNARGLDAFVKCCPFERLFKVLLSPVYLAAMRRRRSSDPMGDTATNLGNAMDELMRHQPKLKQDATAAIIKLLEELCKLGQDPQYVCWRPQSKSEVTAAIPRTGSEGCNSDDEEEDDDETTQSRSEEAEDQPVPASMERVPIPLVDYILNVMKFVDAILSNNSTDDHCREFVNQKGLVPLVSILGLPNLPVDCPTTSSAQAVASVCKSILNLAHDPQVLDEAIKQVEKLLTEMLPYFGIDYNQAEPRELDHSELLRELAKSPNPEEAINIPKQTPLLHLMASLQNYTVMLLHICRTGQAEVRSVTLCKWGGITGRLALDKYQVLLKCIITETNMLLSLCGEDVIDPRSKFALADLEKLRLPEEKVVMQTKSKTWKIVQTSDNGMTSAMEALSTDPSWKMEIDPEDAYDLTIKAEEVVRPVPTPNQLKCINPLLFTASRLSRTITELLALLVKVCVGCPIRRRRGQMGNLSDAAAWYAYDVVQLVGFCYGRFFTWVHPSVVPLSATPLLQMMDINSTLGFVIPLLFDDKKFPYHLMLNEFIRNGVHHDLYESFSKMIGCIDTQEFDFFCQQLPWGAATAEFMENYILLLEKLINPKNLLESPHSLSTKANANLECPFDVIEYLTVIQKLAFDSLKKLWNRNQRVVERVGPRVTAVCLLIWRHILSAEKVIDEHRLKNIATVAPGSNEGNRNNASANQRNSDDIEPDISMEHLNRLVDMGFSRAMSIQALRISPTFVEATEYLLNAPVHNMEIDTSEEDQVHQAIAMSLGEPPEPGTKYYDPVLIKSESMRDTARDQVVKKKKETVAVKKSEIDDLTQSAPNHCLFLLDVLGSPPVFRMCDLFVAIIKRNKKEYRDALLRMILNEVSVNAQLMVEELKNSTNASSAWVEMIMHSEPAQCIAVRLHLFTLLFDEMKTHAAMAVQELNIVDKLVYLLRVAEPFISQTHTPKWLSPLLLLLDLYEKVATNTVRKELMTKICGTQWKWFDINTGKWCPYNATHNRLINESYQNGDQSFRIYYGRRKYTLQFSTMYQCNDETGNRRPIMINIFDEEECEEKERAENNGDMDVEETTSPFSADRLVKMGVVYKWKNFIRGIGNQNCAVLIKSCVFMLGVPVDGDALHAMLRLCLRITRNYEYAMQFASLGGVRLLLGLTHASHFVGFGTLATLLIRHIIEAPHVLRLAMEKVLKSKTLATIPPQYKEMYYMLRVCGYAISRDPDIFLALAKQTLRVDVSLLNRRSEEEDTRLLLKMIPVTNWLPPPDPREDETAAGVISELLNALVNNVDPNQSESGENKDSEQESSITSPAANTTTARTNTSTTSTITCSVPGTQPSYSSASQTPHEPRVSTALQSFTPFGRMIGRRLIPNTNSDLGGSESDDQASTSDKQKIDVGKGSPRKGPSEDSSRPLLPRSHILKMLAEAVRSYVQVCKLIINHNYPPSFSELVPEGCSAISFILDYLLQDRLRTKDIDCPTMARMLIAALAACNHSPETQLTLVSEVKSALQRTLALHETSDKHIQIQQLCNLISVMIDNCPLAANSQPTNGTKSSSSAMPNNIVRCMLRKGLILDLARVPHSLDLSSPNVYATVNAVLKPLEALTLIVNHPNSSNSGPKGGKPKGHGPTMQEAGAQTGSNAGRTQGRGAQGGVEGMPLGIPGSVNPLDPSGGLRTPGFVHTLGQLMGHMLEDAQHSRERFAQEMMEIETNQINADGDGNRGAAPTTQDGYTQHESRARDESESSGAEDDEEEDDEEGSGGVVRRGSGGGGTVSSSTAAGLSAAAAAVVAAAVAVADDDDEEELEEEDDMEEDEGDDESEVEADDDDDDDDDGEENEDEEGGSGYEDIFESDDGLFRVPGLDRENPHDDILMIQYSEPDASMPLVLNDNNRSFPLSYGLFEEPLNESNGVTPISAQHPLMGFRIEPPSRIQRANRQRRYQYLQLNSRNPNPPVILQRLLGPGVHDLPLSASQALASTLRDTRVVVMDGNIGVFNAEDESTDGEQPNYLFGQTLAATLNNVPNALHWWNEEGKLLDGDAMPATVMVACYELLGRLKVCRDKELAEKKEKKRLQAEKDEHLNKLFADAKARAECKKAQLQSSKNATESAPTDGCPRHQTAMQMAASEVSTIVNSVLHPATASNSGASMLTDNQNSQFSENSTEIEARSSSQMSTAGSTVAPDPSDNQSFADTPQESINDGVASMNTPGNSNDASCTHPNETVNPISDACVPTSDSSQSANSGTASYDSDSSTIPAPMETLSNPTSPVNSVGGTENVETEPTFVNTRTETEDGAQGGENGGREIMDQLPRNLFDELDLDAAETWFRTQMEVQPSGTQNRNEGGGEEQSSSAETDTTAAREDTTASAPPPESDLTTTENTTSTNLEIPDGVDPSFLAALPEEMRQEVISEQLRLQRLQQRARTNAPAASAEIEPASVLEVNPEFLAALPPSIQEEVLTQQRLEQQRLAAAAANPNDPVDAAAFFQNLAPTLRQAILTDMEESQISVLPPELAAEAQNLRRDWEARNRQIMQERFFNHVGHGSTALSSILRNPGRAAGRYAIHSVPQQRWNNWNQPEVYVADMKYKGRLILDQETLTCLHVLLFIDDPKLNIRSLQQVLKNLCYHSPTRHWVIKALTSIIEKCNECHTLDISSFTAQQRGSLSEPASASVRVPQPSWLNITMDAGLGSRANVFFVQRPSGKRSAGSNTEKQSVHNIIINPQATSTVAKRALETLVSLATIFPMFFLPPLPKAKKEKEPPAGNASTYSPSSSIKSKFDLDFWDVLLKLDSTSTTKKGKSVARSHVSPAGAEQVTAGACATDSAHFQQLVSMLSYDLMKRSTLLTDRLLRLVNVMTQGLSETESLQTYIIPSDVDGAGDAPAATTSNTDNTSGTNTTKSVPSTGTNQKPLSKKGTGGRVLEIPENLLKLAVDVLTSKRCSQEALTDATAIFVNISSINNSAMKWVLKVLIDGAKQLGAVVCQHISVLMDELQALNKDSRKERGELEEEDNFQSERTKKGKIQDRFTSSTVVITAPSKLKGGCELQLPSMAALTSKTSSQAYFLRILKVILKLRTSLRTNLVNASRSKAPRLAATAGPTAASNTGEAPIDGAGDAPPNVANMAPVEPSAPPENASSSDELDDDTKVEQVPFAVNKKVDDVSRNPLAVLPSLSEQLDVDSLWVTLSLCLSELEHTPDHYAVLVLQPAVEAFFLVHSDSIDKDKLKSTNKTDAAPAAENGPAGNVPVESSPATSGPVESSQESQNSTAAEPSNNQELAPVSPLPAEADPVEASDSSDSSISSWSDALVNLKDAFTSTDSSQQTQHIAKEPAKEPTVALNSDAHKFLKFAEMHRTVLNQILRQSAVHLADGPFAVLVDHTRMLDFDVKRRYFRTELDRLDEGIRREEVAVHVRRNQVFEDSFRELHRRSVDEWKNRFYIVFEGEEGQDAGGLLREWYVIISREIFNPMYALFTTSPGDRVTYMINSTSHCNPNHLSYFKFVGRVIAKAIYDNKLLECYFTRSFYKHILGILVKYTDMESEDYSFYKGLVYLINHDVSDLGYELTFSTEVQEFGVTEIRDLIPNGRNIPVAENNKMDYVRLVCQMKMTGAIRKQLNAFLEGFYDIIPKRLISIFNEQELELLISGLPNVDIEDLKANTEYHKYQSNSLQIQWFWRALRSLDQADRAKFLQFVTGTSKVPLQGFGALEGMNGVQKFQIHRDDRSTDRLPSAHTCFNQLDLPVYETYDKLRSYLLKAIHECSEGFGFA